MYLFRKGQSSSQNYGDTLLGVIFVIAIMGTGYLMMAYFADVQQDVRDDLTPGTKAYEIADTGLNETFERTDDLGTIVTVIFAGITISILLGVFVGGVLQNMQK